jgi:hypothetical protein
MGVALIMWTLGALVAAAGTAVYIELGTVSLLYDACSWCADYECAGIAT